MEKAFTIEFLTEPASIDMEQLWIWTPAEKLDETNLQTATFSGKNKADDYTNE
ncbi:MAG: hypothetical protein RIR79_1697 [Pseudomonadota bacterium]|jgi:hypothetical protein